uniref:7TM_GPCR_Srx domain-containing protein n=1 Tax=Heterorhabditis bacteriophora TaxID=37862 RepID=A0A1I7XHR4_HETBA
MTSEDKIVASIIVSLGILGVIIDSTAAYFVFRSSQFHHSFGYLCVNHMIADVGVLLTFTGWAGPTIIL